MSSIPAMEATTGHSADTRQERAGRLVEHAECAECTAHVNVRDSFASHLTDASSIGSERVAPETSQRAVRRFGRDNGQQLSFVGYIERIESEELARSANRRRER